MPRLKIWSVIFINKDRPNPNRNLFFFSHFEEIDRFSSFVGFFFRGVERGVFLELKLKVNFDLPLVYSLLKGAPGPPFWWFL